MGITNEKRLMEGMVQRGPMDITNEQRLKKVMVSYMTAQ